jgi:hypothetical protein
MRVVMRMAFAFVAGQPTGLAAGSDNDARKLRDELRLSGHDHSGCRADVAAVLAQRDATEQHLDVLLAQASIGTCATALRAIEARFDASDEQSGFDLNGSWMLLEHLPSVTRHRLLLT